MTKIIKNIVPDTIAFYIENNLNDLYTFFAKKGKITFFDNEDICWVKNKPSLWPNFIFNTKLNQVNIEERINEIVKEIKDKNAPPFWIIRVNDKIVNFEKIIENYGMRPVAQWSGMAVDLMNIKAPPPNIVDLSIYPVKTRDNLKSWIEIANSEIFNVNKLDLILFEKLLQEPDIKFFLGFYNGKPVATAMLFFSSGLAGLYMISTLSEYRNKGIGTAISTVALIDARKAGYHIGILHATQVGEKIYRKMGYKEYCKFNIYWMLGKQYK